MAGPVQELGILQGPALPLKLRSEVFTDCDSDNLQYKNNENPHAVFGSQIFQKQTIKSYRVVNSEQNVKN